ncbi:MAG: M1 family metallopeptidase [Vulcanimicrobiota bacterium]
MVKNRCPLRIAAWLLLLTSLATAGPDPHSYCQPNEAVVTHLDLRLAVDFRTRRLQGQANWDIKPAPRAEQVVFDTFALTIERVTDSSGPLDWELGPADPVLGRPLVVHLRPSTRRISIDYQTHPEAPALQWLTPEQTAGRRAPFLFTQSQAILARSWLPCQDSPGVRFDYQATVKTNPGMLALMSAENPQQESSDGVYTFTQRRPIPAYLMALAVGRLAFAPLGERTGVYAEPETVAAAAYEFAQTDQMLEVAEALYGPYRWGRYDLLVLPPSFPFGGMENPRLTFVTPTVIAGDRSLTPLVAHELAHSWSGNLVTNATWNDFWLNEGFTDYFERRIMERMEGPDYAEMLAVLGYGDLLETLDDLGADSPDTRLKLELTDRDPDLGMSDIAYEKGYLFLVALERSVGRPRFDQFLAGYFDRHAFSTMTTEGFVEEVRLRLDPPLDLEAWIYEPGLPSFPPPTSQLFAQVDAELARWLAGSPTSDLKTSGWSSHEWLHFLRSLPENVTLAQMAELDQGFDFTRSRNAELLFAWLRTAVRVQYQPAYPAVEDFLIEVGRRKFVEPLFETMVAQPGGKAWATKIFERARLNYHSLTRSAVEDLLR